MKFITRVKLSNPLGGDYVCKGFIKLDRSIFEHWIFQDAEKFRAFVDLIQLARWKEEKLLIGNELVIIPRGSYYTSELKLAERWGWSRKKTREFLKLLETEQMITKKGTTKGTMLTIENYRFYQDEGTTKDTTKEQQKNSEGYIKGTSKGHQKNNEGYTKEESKENIRNYKNDKEGKEREEESSLPPLSYPTQIHKLISEQISEVSYRTWIDGADIKEDGELIIITVEEFKKKIVQDRYGPQIALLTGKKVSVKVGEQNG